MVNDNKILDLLSPIAILGPTKAVLSASVLSSPTESFLRASSNAGHDKETQSKGGPEPPMYSASLRKEVVA